MVQIQCIIIISVSYHKLLLDRLNVLRLVKLIELVSYMINNENDHFITCNLMMMLQHYTAKHPFTL